MKEIFYFTTDLREIFPGFYESELYNSDTLYTLTQGEQSEGLIAEDEEYDFVDFQAYKKEVCTEIADIIKGYICKNENICDNCEFYKTWSPQYYNYSTDTLTLKLNIDLELLKETILNDEEYRKGFDAYLKAKYTPYDGYLCLVQNEIQRYFKEDYTCEKYCDVLVDYYLFTLICGSKDVVDARKKNKHYDYICQIAEAANDLLYEHIHVVKS